MTDAKKDFDDKARPVAEKLISYAIDKGEKYNITDVRISIAEFEEQDNTISEGKIISTLSGAASFVGITLYSGDRSMHFQKDFSDIDMLYKSIDQAMQVIHLVPENQDKRLLESEKVAQQENIDLDLYDKNIPSEQEMLDYGAKIESAVVEKGGVKTIVRTGVSRDKRHSLVLATNGLDYRTDQTSYMALITTIAEDEKGMQRGNSYSRTRHFSDMAKPETIGAGAIKNTVSKLNSSLPDTGDTTIVLSRAAAASFFLSVFSAIDGTAVHQGTTFLHDKLGKQVMSSEVTIDDEPRIARGFSSQLIDSSGVETKKVTFVKNGVLQHFNAGLIEARKLGIEPIGRNSGVTNVIVSGGSVSKDELIDDIKDGIYIKSFNGGSVNINDGTFSRQAHGVLIKDGKITDDAVSGFVVSGNLKEMFMSVSLANDTPKLPHTKLVFAAPTTRINDVKIAGK